MAPKRRRRPAAKKIRNPVARSPLLGKGGAHGPSKAKRRRAERKALDEALAEDPDRSDDST